MSISKETLYTFSNGEFVFQQCVSTCVVLNNVLVLVLYSTMSFDLSGFNNS